MSESDALLAPFDGDLLDVVADENDVTPERLRELVVAHQRQVRDNPGVEDIVYEWRSQFHEQPVLRRTESTYYLRLRPHVWDEFADALDLTEPELDALLYLHSEQTRRDTDGTPDDNALPMILARD
ncbi:hypothetical protein [Halorientalis salina]|uniref:hypothetical protein n=1 Tax=Halorientalis salina TaxID=2932266 RepID=UPI0010ACACC0|nr:hypothetical protein [Halorientalis salina]